LSCPKISGPYRRVPAPSQSQYCSLNQGMRVRRLAQDGVHKMLKIRAFNNR
jgi:hypothetical protein